MKLTIKKALNIQERAWGAYVARWEILHPGCKLPGYMLDLEPKPLRHWYDETASPSKAELAVLAKSFLEAAASILSWLERLTERNDALEQEFEVTLPDKRLTPFINNIYPPAKPSRSP